MIKYLLASHGVFSEGTLSFLNIMIGKKNNIYTLAAFIDEHCLSDLVDQKIKEIGTYEQLFIFCDLHGGSVEQELFRKTVSLPNVKIISGYNIPLLLDIMIKDQVMTDEEIERSIHEANCAMVLLKRQNMTSSEDSIF